MPRRWKVIQVTIQVGHPWANRPKEQENALSEGAGRDVGRWVGRRPEFCRKGKHRTGGKGFRTAGKPGEAQGFTASRLAPPVGVKSHPPQETGPSKELRGRGCPGRGWSTSSSSLKIWKPGVRLCSGAGDRVGGAGASSPLSLHPGHPLWGSASSQGGQCPWVWSRVPHPVKSLERTSGPFGLVPGLPGAGPGVSGFTGE